MKLNFSIFAILAMIFISIFSILQLNNDVNAEDIIRLNYDALVLENGQSARLFVQNDVDTILYSTNRPDLLQVDDSGFVVGLNPGKALITVTTEDGSCKCPVTIKKPTIRLGKSSLKLKVGKSKILSVYVSSGYHPIWKSSNKKVATVNFCGRIYARKKGVATVSASLDGVTKRCRVTVK